MRTVKNKCNIVFKMYLYFTNTTQRHRSLSVPSKIFYFTFGSFVSSMAVIGQN